jgi:hypothetical protein
MTTDEMIHDLSVATDLVIANASSGRGGSSGELACAKIILALADDQPCDLRVLSDLHGDAADAVGKVITAHLQYGRDILFTGRQQQIDKIKQIHQ